MKWFEELKKINDNLANIQKTLTFLSSLNSNCENMIGILEKPKESNIPKEHSERLAELEVKLTKLWTLLTEETAQGRTKLSKQGKTYKDWLGDPKN